MKGNSKKIGIIAAIGLVLVAVIFLFYYFDPEQTIFFPKCPFLLATGYECAGCGSQRAFHDLLHFNLRGAFSHNPLIFLLVPYILMGIYLQYLGGKERNPKLEKIFFGKRTAVVVLIIIICFWVLRNVF